MPKSQPDTVDTPASPSRWLFLAKLVVSVVVLAVLFSQTDVGRLRDAARRASPWWLAAAVGLYFLMILASAWRWNLLLAAQRVTVAGRALVGSFLVATFFNSFLPSNIGGDVIRVRDTARAAGSTGRAAMIVVIDRVVGLLALLLVAAFGATVVGRELSAPATPLQPVLLWLLFAGSGAGFLMLVAAPQAIIGALTKLSIASRDSIKRRITKTVDMFTAFRAQPGALLSCFAGAVLAQLVLVAFYAAVAKSLGIPIGFAHLAVVVPVSFVVQLLPVSVNGFGVREATFSYYFLALQLPIESALLLSLLGAGMVLLVSLSGGVLYVARRS